MQNDKKGKSIIKAMISVSGIVVLSKIAGFIRQMITANAFGATIETDIISLSEGLISNTDYLLVQALATAFIPVYIGIKTRQGDTSRFVSNTIKAFFFITLILAIIIFVGSPLISRVLAPSYSSILSNKLSQYLRIFSPVLILIVELAIFNSLLKANESFVPGELIGFNQSIIAIVLILLFGKQVGPDILVVGFYAYAVFNLFFLSIRSRANWKIQRGNPFIDPDIKKLLVIMGPLLLGHAMIFINQQVDKIIVSGLEEGTVTAMGYAAVLSNFISTFIGSICGVLFTYITQKIAKHEDKEAAEFSISSVGQLVTLLLPISILTVLNSKDIVTIVFGRGKFNSEAIGSCSLALMGYGFMFVPYAIREVFSRFQYAYSDSKRPTINSTIAIIFNTLFSIILSRFIGVLGVTLATSLSVVICAILNIVSSHQKNNNISIKAYVKFIPYWLIGCCLCIVLSMVGQKYLSNIAPVGRFAIIAASGLLVYYIINLRLLKPLIYRIKDRR